MLDNTQGVFPRHRRRHRQNLTAAKITPLARQLEESIRFHAVCSAVTIRYSNGQQ